MNWSLIIFCLVALTSVTYAANSYLIMVPNLLKVGSDNQISVYIGAVSQPVEVKFLLTHGHQHLESKITCKPGQTQNGTLTLPKEFPVGPGELTIVASGGLQFQEKREIITYDNHHVILVQTSTSTYRPRDTMEIRVVATNENFIPIQQGELTIEVYDAALKLVGEFHHVPIHSGLTETVHYAIGEHVNIGTWLVSATIENTTSSVEVLVVRPLSPSYDLKAIFPRFLLRTDKMLQGSIEISNDYGTPMFGRGIIAIDQITEQNMETKMQKQSSETNQWRQWKSQQMEIAGRLELNYDLLSLFNIDTSKTLAIEIYIQVTELTSGHERVIRHIIPIFTRDIIYDIRPYEFQAGVENEFEIIAKRPDGKPVKMEDIIVQVRMIIGNEQGKQQEEKTVEIKDFYTRGRNDIGFFNLQVPENCIGVLMTITPLDETGKVRGYRTHTLPLMPTPRRHSAKLTIELLPSTAAPVNTNVNVPVVSSQISTVGRKSNFYIQLVPSQSTKKFERVPMSYVLMTNGRIISTGEFSIEPTKECQQTRTVRSIRPEGQEPPTCLFNGTLAIDITKDMIPYSTLLVYTFQPTFGFNVAESYRFSVAGLFQNTLTLNATIVPFTSTETIIENPCPMKDKTVQPVHISPKAQDKTRVELSFTGVPDSTVSLNVFEYDGVLQGLSNEITKERILKHLTTYEQVPIFNMPRMPTLSQSNMNQQAKRELMDENDEQEEINSERMGYQVRYPVEEMIFGVSSSHSLPTVEGDDIYTTSNMERLYGEDFHNPRLSSSSSHYRRKLEKAVNQYDVNVANNDYVVATSMPLSLANNASKPMSNKPEYEQNNDVDVNEQEQPWHEPSTEYGTSSWYEKMNTKLHNYTQEAYTFMDSGLTIISDFDTLRVPQEVKHKNLTKLFSTFNQYSFGIRDEARQLLTEYIDQTDLSIMPPEIMLEEQARTGYYRSIFFNTSRIQSQGTGKVILPQTKPYSTWLATGFALNMKSGLSIAQPIRLPTNQGLYILANFPQQVQTNEHILLTYGINNYLGKDLTNVKVRIHASKYFDLMEQNQPGKVVSHAEKDYTTGIPSLKSFGTETRHMIVVPKRTGLMQIILEVESEFGGDYEVLNVYVRESALERRQVTVHLHDSTNGTATHGPHVEKLTQASNLRSVEVTVSGTGLDHLINKYTIETNSLIGIDRSLVRLYRALALRRYLNETSQTNTVLFNTTTANIITAYQKLQIYHDYDGSYSFISDEGIQQSSLYLTSLAFGAMISPMMPFRDNVTLNRTLNWILSHQNTDGSFDDNASCFHYRFCAGEFHRESLTAIVLYSLTRDNSSDHLPAFIYNRLYNGTNNPLLRAQLYLQSRVPDVISNLITISLFEMAFIQNKTLSNQLHERIHQVLLERKLTVDDDGSKHLANLQQNMTLDDQLLVNAMTVSLYIHYNDYQTASQIAQWITKQMQIHPYYDTILDGVFRTDAWVNLGCLFRQQYSMEKFDITVDITADNGQKQQFHVNSTNMDLTQRFYLTLPVHQISYTVNGFGIALIRICQTFVEQQSTEQKSTPFQLTQQFVPMQPAFNQIQAKTCMTHTPTTDNQKFVPASFNRTVVIDIELPSGTRVDIRELGMMLSNVENVIYFTYEPYGNKLTFFINVPSTMFGKSICLDWCFERLSSVLIWSPIQVRVYDYLQHETELVQLVPIQFQPNLAGYSFVEALQKATST